MHTWILVKAVLYSALVHSVVFELVTHLARVFYANPRTYTIVDGASRELTLAEEIFDAIWRVAAGIRFSFVDALLIVAIAGIVCWSLVRIRTSNLLVLVLLGALGGGVVGYARVRLEQSPFIALTYAIVIAGMVVGAFAMWNLRSGLF